VKHFLSRPREESTVIDSTRPQLSRFKYSVMLVGVAAAVAVPLASPGIAAAQKYWDVVDYGNCIDDARAAYQRGEITLQDLTEADHICCLYTDGVWDRDEEFCHAPPGDAQGSRQFPGTTHVPSDIATVPVTKTPPRPVPSDTVTVSTVS
jgi:type II secretory pathway pseudopilin PulG